MFIHQGRQKIEGKRITSQNTTIESQAATRLGPTSENQWRGFPTTIHPVNQDPSKSTNHQHVTLGRFKETHDLCKGKRTKGALESLF